MLIIAIPKSASTSLMKTLGRLYNLNAKQVYFKDSPIPKDEFRIIWKYHSDMRHLPEKQIVNMADDKKNIFKQHILPTDQHICYLKNSKKVILIRNPEDIVLSYRRSQIKGLSARRIEFDGCISERDWIKRAGDIGLIKDLNLFYKGWFNSIGDKLIIHYNDLIKDTACEINKISRYWNLPESKRKIKLAKERYTRRTEFEDAYIKVLKSIKRFFKI